MSKGKDRLYWRKDRGWYMDLRDLGEGQKACIPDGKRGATKDRDEAVKILSDRLDEIENGGDREDPTLREYAKYHLKKKAKQYRPSTVKHNEVCLRKAVEYFGPDTHLSEINVQRLVEFDEEQAERAGSKDGTKISAQTRLHYLHALSNLYNRAVAEGKAAYNPVSKMTEDMKPRIRRDEPEWLKPGEAARLLKAAAAYDQDPPNRATPYQHPIYASFLYTGGRKSEVLGLLAGDVDFENEIVHIRPNRYRKLKRPHHKRWVPLWPDLRTTLVAYLEGHPRGDDDLLFPSLNGGMISDLRASRKKILNAAGIEKHVTLHTLRHSYTAARMQTLDHGAPVSPYTVMRELGHRSLDLIEKTYGHLSKTRVRKDVVEYREATVVDLEDKRKAKGA